MQNVRANVKVLEFKSFCFFSCILSLLIILIKPLTTKAYDRRASGDCGTSGFPNPLYLLCRLRSIAAHRDHFVQRLSGSHTFLVDTHSYVSQATHAFLGMLPLCYLIFTFTCITFVEIRFTISCALYACAQRCHVHVVPVLLRFLQRLTPIRTFLFREVGTLFLFGRKQNNKTKLEEKAPFCAPQWLPICKMLLFAMCMRKCKIDFRRQFWTFLSRFVPQVHSVSDGDSLRNHRILTLCATFTTYIESTQIHANISERDDLIS